MKAQALEGHGRTSLLCRSMQAVHTLVGVAPALDEFSGPFSRSQLAWHPDGSVLAVPGPRNDVTCYDRDTAGVEQTFKASGIWDS